jgi:pimeloyl-ACP methyl ester carboxylesterase
MAADSLVAIPLDDAVIACHRIGSGPPLLILNGFAATSADWDPSFIYRLASANELVLLDNRGIGGSTDNGAPFDIRQLADDSARVIDMLGFERANVLGWSMGGFIAQTLAVQHPDRVGNLILLSSDPGGTDADLASASVWSQLIDTSGTSHKQAHRLLSLLFPTEAGESVYREFGDVVAAARARLSPELINRQAAAMDSWHHGSVGSRPQEITVTTLIATRLLFQDDRRRLPRPRLPTLADRLRIVVDVDLFQALDAVLHCFGRTFIFFPGRFE